MSVSAPTMISAARRTQEWLRSRPLLMDALFAALMALIALSELFSDPAVGQPREPDVTGVVLVLVGAASLTWRRTAPVMVLTLVVGVSCVFYFRDYASFMAAVGLAGIYAVAVHEGNRRLAWISLGIGWSILFGVAYFTLLDGVDGFRWDSALMHSVETTGRDALADMRRMLGVLRNDEPTGLSGENGEMTPQPSLEDLGTIITHCNDAGTPTELSISGDLRQLAPGLELAAFRTVQEALTNVVKHGGESATASVALHFDAAELHIAVRDTGRGAVSGLTHTGGGHGLIGMRERIEIYDGHLATGPRPGGGYEVIAALPINPTKTRPVVVAANTETNS